MKHMIYYYDYENERVTIRADNIVIGNLSEINVDNVSFVIKTLMEMYQQLYNLK